MKIKQLIILVFYLYSNTIYCQGTSNDIDKADKDSILSKIEFYKETFDYTHAVNSIYKLREMFNLKKDINGVIYCELKLTEINRHAKLFEAANQYLSNAEKSIKLNRNKINDTIIIKYYNRKAALASEYLQNPDSTIYYSTKALELAKEIKNEKIELISLLEIGFALEVKNDLNNSIKLYKEVIKKSLKYNNIKLKNDATINLARTLTKNNQFNEAIKVCEDGLNQLNDTQYFLKLILYGNLSTIYEKKGEYNKALDYLKIRMDYTEKYYQQTEVNKLQELNGKYQLKEKNTEIKLAKERLEQVTKNQILLSLFLVILVLGIVGLIYYSKKLKNSKNKLNNLYKENEFLLNEANHRINNNLQLIVILISEELKKLSGNEKIVVKKILSKVESIATLHRQLYKKNLKDEIEISNYLNEIKSNFSEILEEKNINATFNVDPLKVDIDHGMYIGLLVTELLFNSIKHAFKNQVDGEIVLNIKINTNGYYFEFKDNGKNYNQNITKPVLIDKMCKQLRVEYTITNSNGYHFSFNKNH